MILNWKENPIGWFARLQAIYEQHPKPEEAGYDPKVVMIRTRAQIDVRAQRESDFVWGAQIEVRGDTSRRMLGGQGKVNELCPYLEVTGRRYRSLADAMLAIEGWCSKASQVMQTEEIRL